MNLRHRGLGYDGEFKYGWLSRKKNGIMIDYFITDDDGVSHEVITETIGMCTWLRIKDQVLYEGDIVRRLFANEPMMPMVVTWVEALGRWSFAYPNTRGLTGSSMSISLQVAQWEFLGNIHQDGHLIK